ncbi:hypothetical protein [Candidatus Filomicrobium marinum]|nr:hypothetical protein [Candidatus Filomicrobium marinum]
MPLDLGSHNPVADALAGVSRYPHLTADEYFKQFFLQAERSNAHTMILSAEHFFGGQPRVWEVANETDYFFHYRRKIEALQRYMVNYDVHIIVYLRPQVDWLSSNITQVITHGKSIHHDMSYDDDWGHYRKRKFLLRYYNRLSIWNDVMAPREFHVVPYIRDRLFQQSSVSDFLNRCGVGVDFLGIDPADVKINETLSREYLEVKKILNLTPKSRAQERAVVYCLKRLSRESCLGTAYHLDPALVSDLEAYVAQDNAKIAQHFMQGETDFPSRAKYSGDDFMPLSSEVVAAAKERYEREYRSPRIRFYAFQQAALAFLRQRAKPAHVVLHQLRRVRRHLKYG